MKRKQDTVVQDSGHIIINGEKKEGTAVELKQQILELLNYPPELLTKKSLIYRYTVYTPQEEMKHILLGDKDYRVDTLRKVFGIDKYKRIKENSLIFIRFLKEEIREMKGRLVNYDEKVKILEEKKKKLEEVKLNLERLKTNIDENNQEVERLKSKIKEKEEDISKLKEFKHKLELLEVKISNEREKVIHNETETEDVKVAIIQLNLDIKEINVNKEDIDKLELEIENSKKKLKEKEEENSKLREFKHNLELLDVKIKNEKDKVKHNEVELEDVKKQIIQLRLDLGKEIKVDESQIEKLKLDIVNNKRKLKEVEDKISEFKIKVQGFESIKYTINSMDKCPTCKREVLDKDKLIITREEDEKIADFSSKIKFNEPTVLDLNKKILEADKQLEELRELKSSSEAVELKKKSLEEKISLQGKLEEAISVAKSVISNSEADRRLNSDGVIQSNNIEEEFNKLKETLDNKLDLIMKMKSNFESVELKKKSLEEKISLQGKLEEAISVAKSVISNSEADKRLVSEGIIQLNNVEQEFNSFKEMLDSLLEKDKELGISKGGFEKDIAGLDEDTLYLNSEISKMDEVKSKAGGNEKLMNWLNVHFVNLMNVIERKIMLKVHADFDLLFKKWFEMLIEDDLISVKLDEEFTHLVEQNGYVIEYDYLSGGEKTAIALAYRLSLNQVINNLISVVKTRDLLILDEPTDGFSDDQIERMKDVLSELENKQTLIVSHESKIESFVNCVIKLGKEGHVSSVKQ